jgi:hypothetical protein
MRTVLILAVALSIVLLAAAFVVAGSEPPPPPDVLPPAVGVVGPDGRDLVCPDGNPLTVSRAELLTTPVAPGGPQVSEPAMLVPRCGPGGSVRWVPAR